MRRRDPAGIVFCSQYFVLFHELLEDWFTSASPTPIAKDGRALPIPPNLRKLLQATRAARPHADARPLDTGHELQHRFSCRRHDLVVEMPDLSFSPPASHLSFE